jgi:hypothetical protein
MPNIQRPVRGLDLSTFLLHVSTLAGKIGSIHPDQIAEVG